MSEPKPKLLVLEDDRSLRKTLALELSERGFQAFEAASESDWLALELAPGELEFAIVDLRLGADSGLNWIDKLLQTHPKCRIVVLTGYGSIPTAVEAMKRGAKHYLTKPAKIDDLERALWGDDEPLLNPETAPAETLAQHERDFIDTILLQCNHNITLAAKRLGIHRQSLQRKLRKFS